MLQPQAGDALIRDAAAGYVVVDAVTQQLLGGPYFTIGDAFARAHDLAPEGRIWRQTCDSHGSPGSPFLLELQASTLM